MAGGMIVAPQPEAVEARRYLSYAFAGVHAIKAEEGTLTGGADPSHDGMALAV